MRLLVNKLDGGANTRITSAALIIMRFYTPRNICRSAGIKRAV